MVFIREILDNEDHNNHITNDTILAEILPRCDMKNIHGFKAVCRYWNSGIESNYFKRLYLEHTLSTPYTMVLLVKPLYVRDNYENISLDLLSWNNSLELKTFHTRPFMGRGMWFVVGSINGLICVIKWDENEFWIWNPVTSVKRVIFYVDGDNVVLRSYGFGMIDVDPIILTFIPDGVFRIFSNNIWEDLLPKFILRGNQVLERAFFANGNFFLGWYDDTSTSLLGVIKVKVVDKDIIQIKGNWVNYPFWVQNVWAMNKEEVYVYCLMNEQNSDLWKIGADDCWVRLMSFEGDDFVLGSINGRKLLVQREDYLFQVYDLEDEMMIDLSVGVGDRFHCAIPFIPHLEDALHMLMHNVNDDAADDAKDADAAVQ